MKMIISGLILKRNRSKMKIY